MPVTQSGLYFAEDLNGRRERMRAWKTQADEQARQLEKELKELDPLFEVDFVDPAAANNPNQEKALGIVPGRWHIIRTNPEGVNTWFPICGPNKAYRDPELSIVEEMKKADLWRPGALQELRDSQMKELEAKERQRELEHEQRSDEVALAYSAAKRVNGDGGMTKRTDKR